MRILITGASGLIGSALVPTLERAGDHVTRLVRRPPSKPNEIAWDPAAGRLDPAELAGIEAAINLAGEPIAQRWTPAVKARIRDSRINGTRLLAETLARLRPPPRVLVSSSGADWYGDRGDELLSEDASPGNGFLAEIGGEWEAAAEPARAAGIRVVHPRTAIVLSMRGGALPPMMAVARGGAMVPLGSGRQWWPWITLEDMVAALRFALENDALSGPFNAAAGAMLQRDFAAALRRVGRRPWTLPLPFISAPAWAVRLMLGEMSDVVLGSKRLDPARLRSLGFEFRDSLLEPALRRIVETGA